MIPLRKIEIFEYQEPTGHSPFSLWFDDLDAPAAAKIAVSVNRLGLGNFSNVKGVGGGVFECRVDFGPGFRIYFGKDGERLMILLGGGTKKRQQADIKNAIGRGRGYTLRRL